MEAYKAYIPIDRRYALERGETLPEYTRGAALFTDISGFTALTEALVTKLGPQRGAEELSRYLTNIFGTLTAEIMQFHGSIVSSGGDALLAWFDGQEMDASHRAVSTAFAMQQAISTYSKIPLPDGSTTEILIKSVVVHGNVHRYLVGDADIQVFEMLAGSMLETLDQIENHTRKDEIVLFSETAKLLNDLVTVNEWRETGSNISCAVLGSLNIPAKPFPWEDLSSTLSEEKARAWVLPAIHEHLRSGQEMFMADLRPAVALFMAFSGIDYDNDPEAGHKLDEFIRWVQKATLRYDGSIIDITTGDKGSFLYVVFGAPIAHEDDRARAVALGRQLITAPQHLKQIRSIQIGITHGQVWTGPLGGEGWRSYSVMGNEVNLAARFMEAAGPGQMLVSQRIAKNADSLYNWEMTAEIKVKGREKPISVYQISSEKRSDEDMQARQSNQIIGRAKERALLSDFLKNINQEKAKVAIIDGDAGIGKSRLVRDVLENAKEAGIPLLAGAGSAIEQSTPYYAWRLIFSRLFEIDTQIDIEEQRTKTRKWLEVHDPTLLNRAPLLDSVFGLEPQDNELTAQMNGQVRADNTRSLLIQILRLYIASSPKVLALEDAHWLDSSSWILLQEVIQNLSTLMVIISLRQFSGNPPSQLESISNLPDILHIKLEQMQKEDIVALVCQRLGVQFLPESVETLITEKAEGSPFFSEELAYSLREAGLIEIENGECKVLANADLRALNFPDTVQGVITSRIDRLSPSQQLALKAASVIGRIFVLRAVLQIYPLEIERSQVGDYFEALRKLDITPLNSPVPELTYIFKHLITQEVAYGLMPYSQRQVFHKAAAEWYERAFSDDLAPHYGALAYHWANANEPARAVEYLDKAGEQAMQNFANREAIDYFDEALSYVEQNKVNVPRLRQAHWERQLAEAHYGLGELPKSLAHLKMAIQALGWKTPEAGAGLVGSLLGEVFKQVRFRIKPKPIIEAQLPSYLDDTQQARLLEGAIAFVRLGHVYYQMNNPILLIFGNVNAINLAEKSGLKSPILVRCYTNMCIASGVLPRHDWAIAYRNRAHAMGRDINDLPALSYSLAGCAVYELGAALWEDASKSLNEAIEIDERIGDMRHFDESKSILSIVLFHRGRFQHGTETSVEILERATKRKDVIPQVWSHALHAEILLRQSKPGMLKEACVKYEKALKLLEQNIDQANDIRASGALALCYWRDENPLRALDLATATAKKTVGNPTAPYAIEGYAGVAEVFLNAWEGGDASYKTNAQKACKAIKKFAGVFPLAVPRSYLLQGRFDWLNGKAENARVHWETALEKAGKSDMPYEEARALFYLGGNIFSGEQKAKALSRSLEIFTSIGIEYEAQQVRKLMEVGHK